MYEKPVLPIIPKAVVDSWDREIPDTENQINLPTDDGACDIAGFSINEIRKFDSKSFGTADAISFQE